MNLPPPPPPICSYLTYSYSTNSLLLFLTYIPLIYLLQLLLIYFSLIYFFLFLLTYFPLFTSFVLLQSSSPTDTSGAPFSKDAALVLVEITLPLSSSSGSCPSLHINFAFWSANCKLDADPGLLPLWSRTCWFCFFPILLPSFPLTPTFGGLFLHSSSTNLAPLSPFPSPLRDFSIYL